MSLGQFFIQRPHPWLLSRLQCIKSVKSSKLKVNPGSSYLACFHGDGAYHRVTAVSVSNNEVKVHYVDYGNCLDVPLDDVVPIPPELVDVPALAIPCSLVGGASENADVLQQFSALVAEQALKVTVKVSLAMHYRATQFVDPLPFRRIYHKMCLFQNRIT